MGDPSGAEYGADHALHVSSGVSVFPLRVDTSILLSLGMVPRQRSEPQVASIWASRASDSYVPRCARSDESRNSLPGLAVAKNIWPRAFFTKVVTCCAPARVSSVGRSGSPS